MNIIVNNEDYPQLVDELLRQLTFYTDEASAERALGHYRSGVARENGYGS